MYNLTLPIPDGLFGSSINMWDARRRTVVQTIRLGEAEGRMPVCLRMFHHPELNHGYVCSAVDGSIFHLHKNSVGPTRSRHTT